MKDLIERLRKGIVTSAPYEPMYTVPPAAICLEAADEIERLTELAYHQVQKISGQAIQIEVLTAENKLLHERHHNSNVILKELTAENASIKESATLWNTRYRDACRAHQDRQAQLGAEIVALEEDVAELTAERDLLKDQLYADRKQYLDMRDERNALKADAERYRWLRNDSYDSEIGVWECRDMENRRIVLAGEELDNSVDTAIQGAKHD